MGLRERFGGHDIAPGAHRADVVEKTWLILELISLQDHYQDREKDKKADKPNPINSGEIQFEPRRREILDKIRSLPPSEIDWVVSIDDVVNRLAIWFC